VRKKNASLIRGRSTEEKGKEIAQNRTAAPRRRDKKKKGKKKEKAQTCFSIESTSGVTTRRVLLQEGKCKKTQLATRMLTGKQKVWGEILQKRGGRGTNGLDRNSVACAETNLRIGGLRLHTGGRKGGPGDKTAKTAGGGKRENETPRGEGVVPQGSVGRLWLTPRHAGQKKGESVAYGS